MLFLTQFLDDISLLAAAALKWGDRLPVMYAAVNYSFESRQKAPAFDS